MVRQQVLEEEVEEWRHHEGLSKVKLNQLQLCHGRVVLVVILRLLRFEVAELMERIGM